MISLLIILNLPKNDSVVKFGNAWRAELILEIVMLCENIFRLNLLRSSG